MNDPVNEMASKASAGAVGTLAPDFTLHAVDGSEYSLRRLLDGRRGLALVFMRGTW